ncbi:carbamoyltransferase [bacterium]|nr:carbamoyltransferase [bacterium]
MYIIGISCYYHDSSAVLLKDGKIVAAAEEERFTRIKHDFSFPINAIEFCLKSQKITVAQVEYVAFYEKPLLKFERVLCQFIDFFPKSYLMFVSSMPSWLRKKLRIIKVLKKKLNYKKLVLFIEHHRAHAASAFFASPFEKSAILTVDGVGEWATTSIGFGSKNNIKLIKDIKFPHSLGLFYSAITAYLGFSVNNSEYKVMGLSAYGEMDRSKNKYYKLVRGIVDVKNDGSFRLKMKYFSYCYKGVMNSGVLCKLLGGKARKKDDEITQRHKDIAAALQIVTEEVVLKILDYLYDITKSKNLVMSGGVALNSVLNGKILKKTKFKNLWIQPAAGDGGTSMGAALYAYVGFLKKDRNYRLKNCYLGPGYDSRYIEGCLIEKNVEYYKFKDQDELINETAKLILSNKVVAWFQGKMEWGPRALGNRSILANPLNPGMKDFLNKKVKHRENFRPFAPSICIDDIGKYFEGEDFVSEPAQYMLQVIKVKEKYKTKIPSVVHVNGTSRIQAVDRAQNKLYYDLIKKFGKMSGMPMLINTSFNVRGEPIVCSPEDAIRCFRATKIDCLVIDKFLIRKK